MGLLIKFVGLLATVLLLHTSLAENIVVGAPNGGWDMSTDLNSWVSSRNFFTGDTLIFSFGPIHSVIEVPKADYDACTINTPLQAFTGGAASVNLASQGIRYFICGTPGHCAQGMKIQINTLSASTVTNPQPASPVIQNPTISSPPPQPVSPVIPTPTISLPPPPASPVIPTTTISSPPPSPASPVILTPTISLPPPPPLVSPPPAASTVTPTPTPAATPVIPPSASPQTASPEPIEAPIAPPAGNPALGLADAPGTEGPAPEVGQETNNGCRQVEAAGMLLVVSLLVVLAS